MNRKNLIKALDAARGQIMVEVVYASRTMFVQGNRTDIKNELTKVFAADEETGLTVQTEDKTNFLMAEDAVSEAAPADPVFEDVTDLELQAEDPFLVAQPAQSVGDLVDEALTYGAKFDYDTRQFVEA